MIITATKIQNTPTATSWNLFVVTEAQFIYTTTKTAAMMRLEKLICKTIQTIRATFLKPAAILILLALQDAALKVCFVFLACLCTRVTLLRIRYEKGLAKPRLIRAVSVHTMLQRACHANATDMQCRFTPCCDVLTTRSECRWVRQLEGQQMTSA